MTTTPTYVAAAAGETLVVAIESTTTPGTYTAPLSINLSRSLDIKPTVEKSVIPRADNPSAPGETKAVTTAIDWSCQGEGTMEIGDDVTYAEAAISGAIQNLQISDANTGGLVLQGPAIISAFSMKSDGIGKVVSCTISFEGAGMPSVTPHA